MRVPVTFVVFRSVAVALMVLALVAFGLGLSGHGPLGGLVSWTNAARSWLHINTGVNFG
jgi:hypothetical protein